MPRGRGVKRGFRQANVYINNTESNAVSASDEEGDEMNDLHEQSKNIKLNKSSDQVQVGSDNKIEVDDDDVFSEDDLEVNTSGRRLTEGDIDVDEGDSESAEDEPVEEESEDTLTPAEKASQICRLPAKELCSEELVIFPFFESAGRPLKESYLAVRNLTCLMWSEDPCTQVTIKRLFNYVINNMCADNLRAMIDSGLTARIPQNSVSDEIITGNNARGRPSREFVRSVQRHLTSLALPNNYSPWGTAAAEYNLERLCFLAILFLERYGYVNFGIFKVLAPPLTHVLEGDDSSDKSADVSHRRVSSEKSAPPNKRGLSTATTNNPNAPHIIIIGAGISGLIAARQLIYFGAKVTIMESRDRVGGRIWTYRKNGIHAEFGAMVVTGLSANPIAVLVRQLSLQLVPINIDCSLYDPQGRLVPREIDDQIEEEFNCLLGTAAYLCHTKDIDEDKVANECNKEKPLSLGHVVELLIKYQGRHNVQLKITHRKLISQLLDRKNVLLDQILTERKHIEVAYDEWKKADQAANGSKSNNNAKSNRRNDENEKNDNDGDDASDNDDDDGNDDVVMREATSNKEDNVKVDSLVNERKSLPPTSGNATEGASLPVFNVSTQFEVRRLLSQLHKVWQRFEPLQTALSRVNKQLDILLQEPPKDQYLTDSERHILDWHLANLEFANATQLENLSLRHWDQDDQFGLSGDHCIIQDGYGSLVDKIAQSINGELCNTAGTPNAKRDRHQSFGSGHIELKCPAKRISYSNKGVRVEVLNSALSQDDLIEYEADAVLCTLPLGVLKESINQPASDSSSDLTKLIGLQFDPPLPSRKVDSINRLGFGLLNKVVLVFDKFFWDRSQNIFGHVSGLTHTRGELFLFWSITDKPVLIALVSGCAAIDLENERNSPIRTSPGLRNNNNNNNNNLTTTAVGSGASLTGRGLKEPVVQRAMQILRGIFNHDGSQSAQDKKKVIPNPVDAYVTRWYSDQDSRGSYSYVATGATGADYDILAEPVLADNNNVETEEPDKDENCKQAASSRLFFAGEHTCRCYPATVHGALISGLREAARIANTFFAGQTPICNSGFKLNCPP